MTLTHLSCLIVNLSICGITDTADDIVEVSELHLRVQKVTFHSAVLNQTKSFCVVLPEGYTADREDWPVLYLFHGRGRNERTLVDRPSSREALLAAPFVTVLPDGDDGWYINSPIRVEDRYNDYIEEVIGVADRHYGLSDRPEDRALSGWSMGGYGCTLFAETHAANFGILAPMIGLLDFPQDHLPDDQNYPVPHERYGTERDAWSQWNPMTRAESLRGKRILIITARDAFDRTMNENFSGRLDRLNIDHQLAILDGAHTLSVVSAALPCVVEFVETALLDAHDSIEADGEASIR